MKVLLLLAGRSPQADGGFPLALAEVDGIPLIQHLIASIRGIDDAEIVVMLRREEVEAYHLDDVVRLVDPDVIIHEVEHETRGALCTALLAISHLDNDEELLIVNGNELVDADLESVLNEFRSRELDAGTMVFESVHPRYSFVRLDADELVVEAAEKHPISRNATIGFYWYRLGRDFVRAAKSEIRNSDSIGGAFYICPAFNPLILEGKRIGVHRIEPSRFHPLKSDRQIGAFTSPRGPSR